MDRLEVSVDQETPVTVVRTPSFVYRYAYARAADLRVGGDRGQDYLALCTEEDSVIFALCDGVSQSFYGDLAARMLGEALLTWLQALDDQQAPDLPLGPALAGYLSELTGPATAVVDGLVLPADLPPLLRDVLEQKRAWGSESMFVCGRLDCPGAAWPQGRAVLAWMGDSRLRLWGPEGERTADLGATRDTATRWSTRCGPVGGTPAVFVGPLEEDGQPALPGLLAYSDGLSLLDSEPASPSNETLEALIAQAGAAPTSDDIAVLEIWLGS